MDDVEKVARDIADIVTARDLIAAAEQERDREAGRARLLSIEVAPRRSS